MIWWELGNHPIENYKLTPHTLVLAELNTLGFQWWLWMVKTAA